MGAQNSEQARFSARIAWIASLALGIINSAIVLIFRHNLARAFTDEEEVLAIVAEIVSGAQISDVVSSCTESVLLRRRRQIPYLAVFQIMDDLSACTYGILRGTGLTVRRHGVSSEEWIQLTLRYLLRLWQLAQT